MTDASFSITIPGLLRYELGSVNCSLILGINPEKTVGFRITVGDHESLNASLSPVVIRKLIIGLLGIHVLVKEKPISLQLANSSMLCGQEIEFALSRNDSLAIVLPIRRFEADPRWKVEIKKVHLNAAAIALNSIIESSPVVQPDSTD